VKTISSGTQLLYAIARPEAQQLATYIGWLMHKTWGGIVAGSLFCIAVDFRPDVSFVALYDNGHSPAVARSCMA